MPELIDKSTALYFSPESIGSPDGARCNICWKFNPRERACLEVSGEINGPRGICGLYVHGTPAGHRVQDGPSRKVSKTEAGYIENGPTHCVNCDEMVHRGVHTASPCRKVKGLVQGRACCGVWEPMK